MKPTNNIQDPLHDFFASEWATSLHKEPPIPQDFLTSVLKKIKANKRKERLFNAGCISIALVGIMAVAVFVYPGYQQFDASLTGINAFFAEITRSISNLFRQQIASNVISVPLITYLFLLAVALLGLDGLIRKHRAFHTTV